MDSNWLKPNVFVIQNGKLVPRPNTPEQKKNYRYIHYDPLNNPTPDDYFRETISRLQKENTTLKNQLAKIIQETVDRPMLSAQDHNLQLIRSLQEQVAALKLEIGRKQQQIMEKNHQLTQKDKQILEISNENTRLHLRINSVVKQIEALNKVMSRKDEQILNKKEQIQQYCRTLEKFTVKEKDEQTTMFSDNFQMTPKIQEKIQEEQDEFFSADTSNFDMVSMDRRFMTPQIQSFRLEDRNQYLHMTQQQRPIEDNKNSESSSQNKSGQRIINSFRNSLWSSNQVKQANSLETQASSRVSYVGQDRR